MKIAFVALPSEEELHTTRIAPPLPLAYAAALLEQRRHIVRIYDLALAHDANLNVTLAPLRSFRPHLIVITSERAAAAQPVHQALQDTGARIMQLGASLRDGSIIQAVAQALWRANDQSARLDEQGVIFETLLAFDDDLDALPYPARHLLSLEQYPLLTLGGELQTTICVAQQGMAGALSARAPKQIVAELQSVMREHGIRHFVFSGAPVTADSVWMDELLQQLTDSGSNSRWEATVDYAVLTPELLQQMQQAGCESVCFAFVAGAVLVSREQRALLIEAAQVAHELGLGVRALIQLDPPYNMMPSLIDVSATLGLDAVQFRVEQQVEEAQVGADGVSLTEIAEMARTRYRSSRSRQFFVDRFGPQLGPMLWRVGRAGLLGRTFQRYADGGDESALAY